MSSTVVAESQMLEEEHQHHPEQQEEEEENDIDVDANQGALVADVDESALGPALGGGKQVDLFEAALQQLPRTLLEYESPPLVLAGASDEEWQDSLSHHVVPMIARQKEQLSDRPIVTSTDKVLEAIFPPRLTSVMDEEGKVHKMIQKVSRKQCSREKLSGLSHEFDTRHFESKARESAICPVRRAIHNMMFDELLRQVTIDNPERGLLLLRIRDELRMSLDAYVSLYEASGDYGSTKLQEGTVGKPEMLKRIQELTSERDALKKEVSRLNTKHLSILRCVDERVQTDRKKFDEEKNFWERTRQRLAQHLETVKEMQEAEKRAMREGNV